jgi:hypothetical protein
MCDHCHEPRPTRRQILKTAALSLAGAVLAACNSPATNELPDVYLQPVSDEFGGQVRIDTTKIVIPSRQTPQPTNEYGSIMPRSAWTAAPLQLKNPNPMDGVNKLTIHHSGDGKVFAPRSAADVARHLQIVLQAHLQRGMIDIGYHFAVDPLGIVWQLRSLAYEGQHVRLGAGGQRNNEHNVGLVALGDFNIQPLPAIQRDRMLEMVRLIRSKYALQPGNVYMHGELVQTDCPGKSLKPAILDARQRKLL